ncbi:MAG: type IV secretory system conjugative DNA transfer family protein [Alphaproteobacteria bacterium]|nr:type IV secretory system conjugative DNA transfer family protein [Alphaproteobacteria bacterium]
MFDLLEIITDKKPMFPKRDYYAWFEYFQGVDYITKGIARWFITAFFGLYTFYPLTIFAQMGFKGDAWIRVANLYKYLFENPLAIFRMYLNWSLKFNAHPFESFAIWVPSIPLFILALGIFYTFYSNPYYFASQELGGGRYADDNDIKRLGLEHGNTFVIGDYEGKRLRMTDYQSMMLIGGPGTGKSTGIVIPSILYNDDKCLFINDIKGELFEYTAGHRSKLGPVFAINFLTLDDPKNGIFNPTWNPLSDLDIPPPSPGRQSYIGGLAYFLLDDGPTGTDPYWITTGRSILEGFINYICDKCDQARANDYFLQRLYEDAMDDEDYAVLETYYDAMEKTVAVKQAINHVKNKTLTFKNYLPIGKWDPIPEAWIGRQASFPMMLDMITKEQLAKSSELRARRDAGDPVAFKTDVWASILENILEEARFYGYNRRVLVEVSQIISLPKTQRSSVLSMALSGLAPFKNGYIRERTSSSDISSLWQRGFKNPLTGKWEPTTFYLACPLDSHSFKMNNMFINMYSGTPIIFAPNEGPAGPFPLLYVCDEYGYMNFHVTDNMGTGLQKQFSFLLSCTDFVQLGNAYGEIETLIGNTACKVFMRIDVQETADRLNGLIETKTVTTYSTARDEGLASGTDIFTPHFVMYGTMADAVLRSDAMMTMPHGTHYAFFSKSNNRLIKLKTPFFFEDREMSKLAKIPPPKPLSDAMYNLRHAEDKLPPPEDMSVEPEYMKAHKIAELEEKEERA